MATLEGGDHCEYTYETTDAATGELVEMTYTLHYREDRFELKGDDELEESGVTTATGIEDLEDCPADFESRYERR